MPVQVKAAKTKRGAAFAAEEALGSNGGDWLPEPLLIKVDAGNSPEAQTKRVQHQTNAGPSMESACIGADPGREQGES